MGIPTTGPIRMGGAGTNSIAQVKAGTDTGTPSAVQNVSLRGLSVDGVNDFQYAGGVAVDIAVAGSSPDQTAPHRMSEFRGYVQTLATTYDSTLSEQEFSVDSNIIIRPQIRIQYASGNINVNWYSSSENGSPANGTLVYQIVNPASGYTVRETSTFTGDGANNYTYSNIQPNGSAVSVPTSTFYTDWEPEFESGGGYEDFGQNSTTLTVSLIFEKSGETTFTYNFTLDVELETAGEGGQ
jgi:hypothetical protein